MQLSIVVYINLLKIIMTVVLGEKIYIYIAVVG